MQRHITVSAFKSQCLGLLEEISQSGEELVVTKRGRPLAHVRPASLPRSLTGSVSYLVSDDELIAPIDEYWDTAHP